MTVPLTTTKPGREFALKVVQEGGTTLHTCNLCGECFDWCPASQISDFRIRKLMRNTQFGKTDILNSDTLWRCTTCGQCHNICLKSKGANVYDVVVALRRIAVENGNVPPTIMTTLNRMTKTANCYGMPQQRRSAWATGLDVKNLSQGAEADCVLFTSCAASFDRRTQMVPQALARIFQKANFDFGIMGAEEISCGNEAKHMGEQGLFEELMQKNIASLQSHGVSTIVTISPHCLNTMKNDYAKHGFAPRVLHYTEVLADLIEKGAIRFTKSLDLTVTYHDPCYLGRRNGVYDAPRKVLESIPGLKLVEMKRSREFSFCCGGGGGGMWMNVNPPYRRMSEIRLDEAADVNPSVLQTACPFCLLNFESAVSTANKQGTMHVRDIAEMVLEAM